MCPRPGRGGTQLFATLGLRLRPISRSIMTAMNEILAEAEFRRRVQAAAIAYAVPQQQADELAVTIGKLPGWQQAPYVAAWTHATVLSLIERHEGCRQLDCPVCA